MLESWVVDILANEVTKLPASPGDFRTVDGVLDARRNLPNTVGFVAWSTGQDAYEKWDKRTVADYREEIARDAAIYSHITMSGRILDVGGGAGTVRHFLPDDAAYLSVDPFVDFREAVPPAKLAAYPCLAKPLNFIAACAEFLPLQASTFDWVHMRSMLDHVHAPDLALLEAHRVLRPSGNVVVGLYVDGGKSGRRSMRRHLKEAARFVLTSAGFKRFEDHHMFHPTFKNLQKIITDNGFRITDVFWQPGWDDQVCYITAQKTAS